VSGPIDVAAKSIEIAAASSELARNGYAVSEELASFRRGFALPNYTAGKP
jgi:hypothetical protein